MQTSQKHLKTNKQTSLQKNRRKKGKNNIILTLTLTCQRLATAAHRFDERSQQWGPDDRADHRTTIILQLPSADHCRLSKYPLNDSNRPLNKSKRALRRAPNGASWRTRLPREMSAFRAGRTYFPTFYQLLNSIRIGIWVLWRQGGLITSVALAVSRRNAVVPCAGCTRLSLAQRALVQSRSGANFEKGERCRLFLISRLDMARGRETGGFSQGLLVVGVLKILQTLLALFARALAGDFECERFAFVYKRLYEYLILSYYVDFFVLNDFFLVEIKYSAFLYRFIKLMIIIFYILTIL